MTQGIPILWIHPYKGDSYPQVKEISGVISLGGPMGANDEKIHPWISRELKVLKQSIESGLPTTGVCLGGQLMARAMGGRVEKNPVSEIGWFPIEVNSLGTTDRVAGVAGGTPTVYHWHADTFHLPKDAELLASSLACPRQIFRMGKHAYGFQFHPEADHQLILEWLSHHEIDDDIARAQAEHGVKTVQNKEMQKKNSTVGEKSSQAITAAIGNLFRPGAYEPINCEYHDEIESWSTLKKTVVVETRSDPKLTLRGKITTTITIPGAEFLILQDEKTMHWPIRLDDIEKIIAV